MEAAGKTSPDDKEVTLADIAKLGAIKEYVEPNNGKKDGIHRRPKAIPLQSDKDDSFGKTPKKQ